jgi:hypothetical protein
MSKIILSLGMGVDSVAALTRFLLEPHTRWFDLSDLIVTTAMTGDEFQATADHMQQFALPLMHRHNVRYVQLSRGGQYAASRYAVLSDSTQTERMYMTGPWSLSGYQLAIGSVPQFAHGKRDCSRKAKGEPQDWWKDDELGGEPYEHLMGFSAEEGRRMLRDATYGSGGRRARYPLAEWSWTRSEALGYLHEAFGTQWPRSCCVYCPFAHSDPDYLAERWRTEPEGAALALVMERRSVTLNPRSTLFRSQSAQRFAEEYRLDTAIALLQAMLQDGDWALYDVKRIYHAKIDKETQLPDPSKKGVAWRSVETLAEGTRDQMVGELHQLARARKADVECDLHGTLRADLMPPNLIAPVYPTTEHFVAVGPAGVRDKRLPSFAGAWSQLVDQTALFAA